MIMVLCFFYLLLIAIRSQLMCNLTYYYHSLPSCLSYLYFTYQLCYDKCTAHFYVLCIIATVSISVKIQQKVNKYDMVYDFGLVHCARV